MTRKSLKWKNLFTSKIDSLPSVQQSKFVSESIPRPAVYLSVQLLLALVTIFTYKKPKEWHQSHFNGSWIIVLSFLHPHRVQGWVVGSAAVPRAAHVLPLWPQLLPVGKLSVMTVNRGVRACCVMPLTGLNFVKLVTNLNSCSLKVL